MTKSVPWIDIEIQINKRIVEISQALIGFEMEARGRVEELIYLRDQLKERAANECI